MPFTKFSKGIMAASPLTSQQHIMKQLRTLFSMDVGTESALARIVPRHSIKSRCPQRGCPDSKTRGVKGVGVCQLPSSRLVPEGVRVRHTGSPAAGGVGRVERKRVAHSSPGLTWCNRGHLKGRIICPPLLGAAGRHKKPVRSSSSCSSSEWYPAWKVAF